MAEPEKDQRECSAAVPLVVQEAVLGSSQAMPEGSIRVQGYDFGGKIPGGTPSGAVDYHALLQSYRTSGFQATNFGLAVEQITQMVLVLCALSFCTIVTLSLLTSDSI